MTIAQAIIQKVLTLPAEKQQRVLKYAQQVEQEPSPRKPLYDPCGIAAGLGDDLSLEDFQANRARMWGKGRGLQ